MSVVSDPLGLVRRLLQGLVAIGLAGTAVELLLLEHYEELAQWLPLGAIALALGTLGLHAAVHTKRIVRLHRTVMAALVVLGAVGVVLHYEGSLEFQRDMDPTASSWQLFTKAIRAKAPPTLAPGVLAQLGLLGLVSTYRDPALLGAATRKEASS
jgi:hypothetical protein